MALPSFKDDGSSSPRPNKHELRHPLSDADGEPASCTVELTVSDAFIRWLVVEQQGALPLVLMQKGADGDSDSAVCELPVDVSALLFGKQRASAQWAAGGALGALTSEGTKLTPMPAEMAALASSCAVLVETSVPLLSQELLAGLNPMAVTVKRADSLPGAYSGTPFKRPYEELAERCAPVTVSWSLLGTTHVCSGQPHGSSVTWNERHLILAGARAIPPSELERQLRERLGELIPRRPTDAAAYAPGGIAVRVSRRFLFELEVSPCERPKKRPEPEETAAQYYPGSYVESGTEITLELELAAPLNAERAPRPAAELQRVVTLIRYNDTPTLLGLLGLVKAANDAIGMNSASAWESYKEEKREDLDLVTGVQIVDGETRLFVYEGQPASFEPLNAMGRLMTLLERKQPNSPLAFTLMNSSITFPHRLYNSFEMPTKLIKLRSTLPNLLLRPDVYQYLRVAEGCRDALLCLGALLRSTTLRYAHKAAAFPYAAHLLQLEKKFGGVQLVVDREGVVDDDDGDDAEIEAEGAGGVVGAPSGARSHAKKSRRPHASRKAATDCHNRDWFIALCRREEREASGDVINWLARNIADLPVCPPPAPLPEWYLASIPQPKGPVYMYSGQRLNQTDVQKQNLRTTLADLHKKGQHMSYNRDFLWSDSMGDREERVGHEKADAELKPWDSRAPPVYNRTYDKDGHKVSYKSHYRMLQPSNYRTEELRVPWDEEALNAARRPIARDDVHPTYADGTPKPRFDPNPMAPGYLDKSFENYRSIFQQTEEGMAAERQERVEGAIETWTKKLVVHDPVMRVDLKTRDRVPQTEKCEGILKDAPHKRALKSLYRGSKALTLTEEPSAFMGEATVDLSLRSRGEGLRATWSSQKWPEPAEGMAAGSMTRSLGKSTLYRSKAKSVG